MARISLIVPSASEAAAQRERVEAYRQALEGVGHKVEIVAVADDVAPGVNAPTSETDWKRIPSELPGLAGAAVTGMVRSSGDVLVVVDVARGYANADLVKVISPLIDHEAELAVGARWGAGQGPIPLRVLAALFRRVVGTGDPLSGLLAMTRRLVQETEFAPAGSQFTMEVVIRTAGEKRDVLVGGGRGTIGPRVSVGDVRQLKRLADERFGTLSRLVQFCAVGASGMVVDLSSYALLQWAFAGTPLAQMQAPVVGGPLALAVSGALAIWLALTWNFSLNRRLTFNYARQGSLVRQYLTYALGNGLGIALSFTLRLFLPAHVSFFHRHRLAAAVVGIVTATGVSFSMARWLVFRRRPVDRGPAMVVATEVEVLDGPQEPGPHSGLRGSYSNSGSSFERI